MIVLAATGGMKWLVICAQPTFGLWRMAEVRR